MELTEKTVRRTDLLDGRVLKMHLDEVELPDGNRASRECVDHPGGVCVAALTKQDELLFVRQFRYPYREVVRELPAGKRDLGETPEETGRRELREETGVTAGRMIGLGRCYPSPGYTDEVIYLFGATDLQQGETDPDEDEFLEVERVPFAKAVEWVMSGELPDAKTQIAVLKLWQLRLEEQI